MLHALLIAAFAVLILRDQFASAAGAAPMLPLHLPGWAVLVLTLGPMVLCVLAVQWSALRAVRRVDRGSLRAVARHDGVVLVTRLLCGLAFAAGVLVCGWLDLVRGLVGDRVLIDEALAVLPLLVAVVASWWSAYPLERRLREAVLIRELDEGKPVHPIPGRGAQIVLNIRHQMLLALVPMLAVTAWSEWVDRLLRRAAASGHFVRGEPSWMSDLARSLASADEGARAGAGAWLSLGLHLAGVVAIVIVLPLVLRRAWDTVPLEAGPLRERLLGVCRASRVRVRRVLVWRTRGTLVNGAVLGVTPPWRYVLLTDALLEHLQEREVEAVMAHELGHIRRGHIPWLLLSVMALAGGFGLAGEGVFWLVAGLVPSAAHEGVQLGLAAAGLVLALIALGYVSRRFEWQADAFAAQVMSRAEGSDRITPSGAGALQAALAQVAELNAIPPDRFGFRHGSIASRVARLGAAVGGSVDQLPIDRRVRTIKWCMALLLTIVIGVTMLAPMG